MKCSSIIEILKEFIPEKYAEPWDNVGLLVGNEEKEIKRIMLAVDATDSVIRTAYEKRADMLITHHPLIFSGLKKIEEKDFIGRRISQLIRADIVCYAMHTNFDIAGDMAGIASNMLGIKDSTILEPTCEGMGIGRIGLLGQEMTLKTLAQKVKEVFSLEEVRVYSHKKDTHGMDFPVKRAAVSPGSGSREIPFAVQQKADVLITGDIGHHDGLDAMEMGLSIIDAGHYGLEKIFVPFMETFFKEQLSEKVDIITEKEQNPFYVIGQ